MGFNYLILPEILAYCLHFNKGKFMKAMLKVFVLLVILGMILNSCNDEPTPSKPVPPPVPDTPVQQVPTPDVPSKEYYTFDWNNVWWNKVLAEQIKISGLDKLKTTDMKEFGYKDGMDPVEFWGKILVRMAYHESGFKKDLVYKESFKDSHGNYVRSTGLFQISIESANNRNRGDCKFTHERELKDAELNIRCSVKIFTWFIKDDKRISGKSSRWLGPSRYWSVLRTPSKLESIKKANN
jgi:hypothetical protein